MYLTDMKTSKTIKRPKFETGENQIEPPNCIWASTETLNCSGYQHRNTVLMKSYIVMVPSTGHAFVR